MERQALHLKKQPIIIRNLIHSAINDCQILADNAQVSLSYESSHQEVSWLLDYHWCYRALVNLMSNAIGYANSKVIISMVVTSKQLILSIEDDGKGIDEDKLDVIFTPFVKLDADRSREQGHFGLGLAICTKVMDWHEGAISAEPSKNLSGACFTLTFNQE
jgi:signal transduction histidine kinase